MTGTKYKKKIGKIGIIKQRYFWIAVAGIFILGSGLIAYALRDMPNPRNLTTDSYAESSKLFDRKGKLLYEMYSDKRRTSVTFKDVPDSLKMATLAIEDANFYKHNGFDFKGILRGLFRTVFQKRLQGGSTLTQQLVKNALLTPERTWTRKIKEAIVINIYIEFFNIMSDIIKKN